MSLHNPISKAVRWALLGAVAASAPQTFAADEPKGEVERIEVTGSRIKRTDVEGANPVTVVDRQAIEKSGVTSTGELLQRLPSIAGAATNPAVNNGGGTGAAAISMRGIGSQRTLMLINGRRFVDNDANAVPMNIIERVEVLKDGASAIYGSDAIGGVVNFITRKDFDGVVTNAYYGQSSENDGLQSTVDFTAGTSSEKGNFVVGMSYTDNDEIGSGDRAFSNADRVLRDGVEETSGSLTVPWVRYEVPDDVAAQNGFGDCPAGAAGVTYLTRRGGGDGSNLADYRCLISVGANNDRYNYQPDNFAMTPVERKSVFFQGQYALSDDIEFFTNATYNNTLSNNRLAPNPEGGLVVDASNPYNPFGVSFDTGVRVNNFGYRSRQFETTNLEMTNGLRGNFGDSWSWDAAYTWAQQTQYGRSRGYLIRTVLDNAIGPAHDSNNDGINDTCGADAANAIDGCTPINVSWLGDTSINNQALRDIKAAASPLLQSHEKFQQQIIEANLTGDLFELPAGPVGFATGVQHRWLADHYTPDALTNGDNCQVTPEACDSELGGDYDVDELYVEFNVPLLSDAPLAKSLELSLGSRYSDYSSFGETTNSKVGLLYQPVDDVKLRATWAEVFRAPTIGNLYSGQTPSADTFTDPCNGITTPGNPACVGVPTDGSFENPFEQLNAIKGGNPELQPETGNTLTVGAVYAPSWLENFSTTVDYYKIELEDTIATVGTQNILNLCFRSGQYCDRITRGPNGILSSDRGEVVDVTSNVGTLETEGVDLNLRYLVPETGFGSFAMNFDSTYIIKYDRQALAGESSTIVRHAGMFYESTNGGDGNYPRWRASGDLTWNSGDWEATYGMRYIHHTAENFNSADACLAAATRANVATRCPLTGATNYGKKRDIPAYVYHDVQASYTFSDFGTRLTLGIENLMDKQPPRIYTGFNGDTDVRTYDTVGRFYYARATVKF